MSVLKVYDGSTFVEIDGIGDVVGPDSSTDNAIARYHLTTGKVIQDSTATIGDDGVMAIPGLGIGGYTDYDLKVGETTTPDYGMIQIGNASIGRTSYSVGAIDLNGTVICRNISGPVTSEIEFIWTESTGGTCRFALPKSGVGNATYNPRSMLLAGPAPADTDFVKVSYWQAQGIFHNLTCDTSGTGADLGVEHDLEVEGKIWVDTIGESTTDAGVTTEGVLLKDGEVDGVDVATAATAGATIADHAIVRGAGGSRGVQDSAITVSDLAGNTVTLEISSASPRTFAFANTGGGNAHLDVQNNISCSALNASVGVNAPYVTDLLGSLELNSFKVGSDSTIILYNSAGGQVTDGSIDGAWDVGGNITVGGTVDGVDVAAHHASTTEHGATGAVVGTTNTQTLTNKSIVATQLTGTIAGARLAAKHKTHTKALQIPAPADEEEYVFAFIPDAATITQVITKSSAGTVNFNIERRAEGTPGTAGTALWSSDKSISTSSVDYPGAGAFNNENIAANSCLAVTFDGPSSIGTVWILVSYTIDD